MSFAGIVLEGGNPRRGPWAPPGRYRVRLAVDGETLTREFDVVKDPRLAGATDADLHRQFDLAMRIREAESRANQGVIQVRRLADQAKQRLGQTDDSVLRQLGESFLEKILAVAGELYQLKNRSPKDKIAFPIRLNDRLTGLRSRLERGDGAPPAAYIRVFEELSAELSIQLRLLERLLNEDLPHLNEELERRQLRRIGLGP